MVHGVKRKESVIVIIEHTNEVPECYVVLNLTRE